MQEIPFEQLVEHLSSPRKGERLRALKNLEVLACRRKVAAKDRLAVGRLLAEAFLGRDRHERLATARFLDVWSRWATDDRLCRRLIAIHMEESSKGVRANLEVAIMRTMPNARLVSLLASPPQEMLTGETPTLLVLLDALANRIRSNHITGAERAGLIRALRKSRAHRASRVARPFLWRVEALLAELVSEGVPSRKR